MENIDDSETDDIGEPYTMMTPEERQRSAENLKAFDQLMEIAYLWDDLSPRKRKQLLWTIKISANLNRLLPALPWAGAALTVGAAAGLFLFRVTGPGPAWLLSVAAFLLALSWSKPFRQAFEGVIFDLLKVIYWEGF